MNLPAPTAPSFSVVICSYNGAAKVATAVRAVLGQRTSHPFEVLVVDDGSSDGTAAVAAAAGARVVTQTPNQGLSAARNRGIAETSGEFVIFTDDDCVPPPDWIDRIAALWKEVPDGVLGVGGHTVALDRDSLCRRFVAANNPLRPLELDVANRPGFLARLSRYLRDAPKPEVPRFVYSLVGANMSFRRSVLESVGGFDPVITFGGDEEDLCCRIRGRFGDASLWVDPAVVVAHDFEASLRDTLRRSRAYGRGNGRDFARHGGIPALRPLPFLAALLALFLLPFSRRAALVAFLALPALLNRRLLVVAWRTRSLEGLVYPYVVAAQEVSADLGFWQGWRRHRRPRN